MNDREPDRNTIEGWQALCQTEHTLCHATPSVVAQVLRDTADELVGMTYAVHRNRLRNLADVIGTVRRFTS